MATFDPNAAASVESGIFGLPYSENESSLVFLPVPWEVTTSYGGGTSKGPSAILQASRQVDLFDLDILRPYEAGLFLLEESNEIKGLNEETQRQAQKVIEAGPGSAESWVMVLKKINEAGEKLNAYVHKETMRQLERGKIVAILGGDHSVPYGALTAIAKRYSSFGILHFDAHSDTRNAFEGFTWSHASIMYNVMQKIPQATSLVQVGVRDLCEEEVEFCESQGDRIRSFYDRDLSNRRFQGHTWEQICDDILAPLPNEVWISFDIDGLDPRYCPHTGTPVPGGLDFNEATYLIQRLVDSGRRIIGFDLCEVSPGDQDEWDANVGARLLYKLSAWTLASQKKVKKR